MPIGAKSKRDVRRRRQIRPRLIDPAKSVFEENKRNDFKCEHACIRYESCEEGLRVGILGLRWGDLRHGGMVIQA